MKKLLITLTLLSFSLQASDPSTKNVTPSKQAGLDSGLIGAVTLPNNEGLGQTLRLIKDGANVNAEDMGKTVLLFAVSNGNVEVAKALIAAGADVNLRGTSYQRTPLSEAVFRNNSKMVELLLDHGAEKTINIVDASDQTALDYANATPQRYREAHALGLDQLCLGNRNDYDRIIAMLLSHGAKEAHKETDSDYESSDISDQD